ncbi:MAG: TetR/AcrR family transcriptional regulator [Jatrophihabitans sp.]
MTAEPMRDAAAADGRRLRWTEHRAQRRAGFVTAGTAAVDTFGPNASAEQIAESAGVSRTVLYRYFRDREDLRQAIAEHVVQAVVDSVLPKLELGPDSTPRQVIAAAIGVIVGWLDEHPNLYRFLGSRRDGGLESVETTLADRVAALLKLLMMFFGIEAEEAEPGAYGIVGFVEATGAWWLSNRTMPRDKFAALVCTGVWHLLEGTARDHGLVVDYDAPLPIAVLTSQEGGR